jgi:hypothetical protein
VEWREKRIAVTTAEPAAAKSAALLSWLRRAAEIEELRRCRIGNTEQQHARYCQRSDRPAFGKTLLQKRLQLQHAFDRDIILTATMIAESGR